MTHFVGRTIAGALVGVSAVTMSAHAQTVTNPLQNAAPANERSGQADHSTAKDAAPPKQQADRKQGERDAIGPAASQGSGSQSTGTQSSGSQNSGTQNTATQKSDSKNQPNSNSQKNNATSQPSSSSKADAKNQGNTGSQTGANAQRDRSGRSSSAREHTAMKATDMRGPDIGLWFNRGNRDSLVISDVSTRGPIARLGFHEGDRIVSVNGHRVAAEAEFIDYLLSGPGDRVEVIVTRDGRNETIFVDPATLTQGYGTTQVDPIEQFGVVLDDRYDDRIVIWRVIPRSPAYYAGMREGDVISTLSGRPYTTRRDFEASVGDLKAGEANLQVRRGDRNRDLTVDVPEFERGAGSKESGAKGGEEQGTRDQGGQSANRDRSGDDRGNGQNNNQQQGKQNTPNTGNGAGGGERRDSR